MKPELNLFKVMDSDGDVYYVVATSINDAEESVLKALKKHNSSVHEDLRIGVRSIKYKARTTGKYHVKLIISKEAKNKIKKS